MADGLDRDRNHSGEQMEDVAGVVVLAGVLVGVVDDPGSLIGGEPVAVDLSTQSLTGI